MKEKLNKVGKKINMFTLISLVCGILLGIVVTFLVMPKRVAKLKSGEEIAIKLEKYNISADDVYNDLKEKYATSAIFDLVDKIYLESIYEITEEDEKVIKSNAEYYYNQYEQYYQKTKEDFLKENGFFSEDKFIEYLRLDYLRSLYYNDYLKKQVKDKDVEDYYKENVYAPFEVEHILVRITSDVNDDQAKEIATNILNDINNGLSFDDAKTKYKDQIITENFEVNFKVNLEKAFLDAAKEMTAGKISTNLVKTSYGYHIIYKKDLKEMPTLEESKDAIVDILSNELRQDSEYSYEKVLIEMRKEAKMDIQDDIIKSEYKKYIKSIKNSEE